MIIIFDDDDESPIFKLKYDQKDLFKIYIYIYNSVINNNKEEEKSQFDIYDIYLFIF